jgi:hypothetical protein
VKGFQKAPKYHVISQVQWWPKVSGHHKIQTIFIVSQIAYINICSLQIGNNIKFQLFTICFGWWWIMPEIAVSGDFWPPQILLHNGLKSNPAPPTQFHRRLQPLKWGILNSGIRTKGLYVFKSISSQSIISQYVPRLFWYFWRSS